MLATNAKGLAQLSCSKTTLPQRDKLDVAIAEQLLPALVSVIGQVSLGHGPTLKAREYLLNMLNRCSRIDDAKTQYCLAVVLCGRDKD